ncbi:MAG: TlpA family protein disulfide reductase [Proteobacteria bacterium]|nr:TlpA family protein disulfide reductase [Pseudomonadota bacterium]
MMRALVSALIAALLLAAPAQAAGPQSFERGSWTKLRAAHAGKPTVIHFWGLTCGPCLAEMPKWGKLLAERPDIDLVLIAADPVPQSLDDVAATVARNHLERAESWSFTDRFFEKLRYEIDPRWAGELPRTLLIDAAGNIVAMNGVADLAKVRTWLDQQKK